MKTRPTFPAPYRFNDFPPITLVEIRMRFYSGKIRAKPRWWEKVHDPEIVAKWRAEIIGSDQESVDYWWGGETRFEEGDIYGKPKQWPREPITDAQLDYIIDELKYEASKRDQGTGIFVSLYLHTTNACAELVAPAGDFHPLSVRVAERTHSS